MKRIVIAGGAGYLGQVLARHFHRLGWEVRILGRRAVRIAEADTVLWDGATLGSWTEALEGAGAVVNLCGRSVDCRYTRANKREILHSRVDTTRLIGAALRACENPPPLWINASTATIYEASFDRPMTERDGALDHGFSASVAKAWENAFFEAEAPGVRKIALRTSLALGSGSNSALPVLARLARLGLGGRIGDGRQMFSWIHEEDFARAVFFLAERPELEGVFNLTAPAPVTNGLFMENVRSAVGRSVGLPTPEWALRIGCALLRTEPELVLKSRFAFPERLLENRFVFRFPFIDEALADLLPDRGASKAPSPSVAAP